MMVSLFQKPLSKCCLVKKIQIIFRLKDINQKCVLHTVWDVFLIQVTLHPINKYVSLAFNLASLIIEWEV